MLKLSSQPVFRPMLVASVFMLMLSLFAAPRSKAQSTSGTMIGRVFKPQGEPLPNAKVTLIYENNGTVRATLTDSEGRYIFTFLYPGLYTISASAEGYLDSIPHTGFRVPLNFTSELRPPEITMRPVASTNPDPGAGAGTTGAAQSESGSLVNTTDATRRANFTAEQIESLPLGGATNMRTFDELALLAPGVVPPPQAYSGTIGPGIVLRAGLSVQFSVNGLRSRANNFTVDGSDSNVTVAERRQQKLDGVAPCGSCPE